MNLWTFMEKNEYTEYELSRLHEELYNILTEIIRVCDKLNIPYFILGGTAIGAFFEQCILPWDDDIDIGMTRENYRRFLREAPSELRKPYFLQWMGTDYHTPYYFAKVRKDDTMFVEKDFKFLKMHHGIFVDVFPFDKVPDNKFLQKLQRTYCNFINCCFMGKEVWMWNKFRKCNIEQPHKRALIPLFLNWIVDATMSKHFIFKWLSYSQAFFNNGKHTYYNLVLMPRDHISVKSIENPQYIPFGHVHVWAPSDLETYLHHHYANLRRYIPKEEQQNHKPTYLSFDTTESQQCNCK